jgi:ABC-type transport system involved in multi-copper enzyme maturation permease subunit
MKDALVIAAREFAEKRFVAYAAVAFAILNPLVLGLIPMSHGKSPREAIAILSLLLATGFTLGLAVISGASFVSRDLVDGRMSFYFSRPVASTSIWFGKLIAGILMIVGCFGLIIAPAWLAASQLWQSFLTLTLGESTEYILLAALALFLIAHVIGTFARSGSPLIAADFAAAVLGGVAIWFLTLLLAKGLAFALIKQMLIALGGALTVAIIGGGAWQLERGRTDRRRNHLALSQFLWGTMAVALIIAAGYVAWVVSVTPADLNTKVSAHAAGSPFLVLAGQMRNRGDYNAAFLIDVSDGSARRIDPQTSVSGVLFTRDGKSAVVKRSHLQSLDLVVYRPGVAGFTETGLTASPTYFPFFVSDDGNRIATIDHGNLSIYDVPQKRSLVSVRVPSEGRLFYRGYFLSPDVFRLYIYAPGGLSIFEIDTRVRRLNATGSIASGGFVNFALDATAARMLVRLHNVDGITLNDARSGAVMRQIVSGTSVLMARFLRDGRMAIVDRPSVKTILHILSADGTLQRDVPLPGGSERLRFVGDDGTRLVLSTLSPEGLHTQTLTAINIDSGNIERNERGAQDWTMTGSFSDNRPPIQPLREVFYGDDSGHVIGWSPATGARRMITGG